MKVLFEGTKPTPFRSAALGVEVTLSPGLNEISDEELAREAIIRGVVKPVADVNPNITHARSSDARGIRQAEHVSGKEHEPQYAPENQGIDLDRKSLAQTGLADPGAIAAAQSVDRSDQVDAYEQELKDEAAAGIPLKDGVHVPAIRSTPIVGTEAAGRTRLSAEERVAETNRRGGHVARNRPQASAAPAGKNGGKAKPKAKAAPSKKGNARQRRE